MNTKPYLLAGLVAFLVTFGVLQVAPKDTQTIIKEVPSTSAISSPTVNSDYFSFGGVRRYGYNVAMNAATTTLCAIKSPAATSTLVQVTYQITRGTSTAAVIDVAKGNTAFATTTLLVTGTSVSSGAQQAISWTSAGATAADDIMAPSTYVLVKTAGAGVGGYTYGGNCTALFQEL